MQSVATILVLMAVLAAPMPAYCATAPTEFDSISLGAVVGFGVGSSAIGVSLLGDLGAEFVGVRSFRQTRWLVQWDGLISARGGIVGNTLPYIGLAGIHTLASAAGGYRWMYMHRWSLYTGVKVTGDFSLLVPPGGPYSDLKTLNDIDSVGGLTARGALRFDVGVSFIDGRRSLLLVGFFQEALQAPGVYAPAASFSEGGLEARFDVAHKLTIELNGLAGRTPVMTQAALQTADQATYAEVSGQVRKIFVNGMWLTLSGSFSRQFDRRTYQGSAIVYDTANAPAFGFVLLYGISLDVHHRLARPR